MSPKAAAKRVVRRAYLSQILLSLWAVPPGKPGRFSSSWATPWRPARFRPGLALATVPGDSRGDGEIDRKTAGCRRGVAERRRGEVDALPFDRARGGRLRKTGKDPRFRHQADDLDRLGARPAGTRSRAGDR